MKAKINLKWSDLVSPTLSPDEYLKTYRNKIKSIYESYEPKEDIIEKIKEKITSKNQKLKIVAFGADWCPDCTINVPKMIKIIKSMVIDEVNLHILYGIMVDGFHKSGQKIWHKTRSPPEALNPKFNLEKIPTFYIFNKEGDYLGAIIENPKLGSTLEKDTLEIIEENL